MPEDKVKVVLSQNRRQVKNRGSARKSRLGRTDRLISLKKEKGALKDKLEKLQRMMKRNMVI